MVPSKPLFQSFTLLTFTSNMPGRTLPDASAASNPPPGALAKLFTSTSGRCAACSIAMPIGVLPSKATSTVPSPARSLDLFANAYLARCQRLFDDDSASWAFLRAMSFAATLSMGVLTCFRGVDDSNGASRGCSSTSKSFGFSANVTSIGGPPFFAVPSFACSITMVPSKPLFQSFTLLTFTSNMPGRTLPDASAASNPPPGALAKLFTSTSGRCAACSIAMPIGVLPSKATSTVPSPARSLDLFANAYLTRCQRLFDDDSASWAFSSTSAFFFTFWIWAVFSVS